MELVSNSLPQNAFHLHLKECKFRFDQRHAVLYKEMLTEFRTHPLSESSPKQNKKPNTRNSDN
jgi:hypothetical protein